jgi:hypothetical protein
MGALRECPSVTAPGAACSCADHLADLYVSGLK